MTRCHDPGCKQVSYDMYLNTLTVSEFVSVSVCLLNELSIKSYEYSTNSRLVLSIDKDVTQPIDPVPVRACGFIHTQKCMQSFLL